MNTRPMMFAMLALCSAGFALAQTGPGVSANPSRGATGAAAPGPTRAAKPLGPPLQENVTISVKGTYLFDLPVDFSITGSGPEFSKDDKATSSTASRTRMNFSGNVSEDAAGFLLEYAFQMALPIADAASLSTSADAASNTVSYHVFPITSSIRLKPGQPVEIWRQNDQVLTITLTLPDAS